MFRPCLFLLFASFVFNLASDAKSRVNCVLASPPGNAAAMENHGFYYFVFPREIPQKYTGCQITWDEHGRKEFLSEFTIGKLTTYVSFPYGVDEKPMVCRYEHGELKDGGPKDCPEFDAVKNGMFTGPEGEDPPVPAGRDARLRRTSPKPP